MELERQLDALPEMHARTEHSTDTRSQPDTGMWTQSREKLSTAIWWKRVRCDHSTPHAIDCAQSRWLATDAQIIFLTKINTPNYPPNQWQLEDTRNDAFEASWHTPSWAWMWSVAQWAHNFASIWCGWQRWRSTRELKEESGAKMKQLTDDKGELNGEGKKSPATNQVRLYRCVSSADSINSLRVTEIPKRLNKQLHVSLPRVMMRRIDATKNHWP